jgi:hypothetical protein
MKIYKVLSTNMDVRDGIFEHGYFIHKIHAEDILKGYVQIKESQNQVFDLDGELETYFDHNCKHNDWYNKPAVYYKSYYGNYSMVMWIKEVYVQE